VSSEVVEAEAELLMNFENEKLAELVLRSLEPDNEPLPEGLKLDVKRDGRTIRFRIYSRRAVSSLLATIDDILAMAILVLRTVKAAST